VLQEHVDQVQLLITSAHINRQAAIQAVAEMVAPGNGDYRIALDRSIAPEGVTLGAGETYIG
jgi:hypothetical protein